MAKATQRTCLVTGAAGGIGLAIARKFRTAGERVIVADIDTDGGPAAAAGIGAEFVALDVTDEGAWREVVAGVTADGAALDVLVNNAGIDLPAEPQDPAGVSLESWQAIMAVNLNGVMLGCREALGVMRPGAAIVNVSSIAAVVGTPMFAAYGASKAAVMQLTKSIAAHSALNGLGIRCNSVHPGIVETRLVREFWRKLEADGVMTVAAARQMFLEKIPLGEFATADDIADSVAFLASTSARHIIGAHLVVDGGVTLNAA